MYEIVTMKYPHVINVLQIKNSQALMVHACNPSYSEAREQEDLGSKPGEIV
jgi:hypothetical protein